MTCHAGPVALKGEGPRTDEYGNRSNASRVRILTVTPDPTPSLIS